MLDKNHHNSLGAGHGDDHKPGRQSIRMGKTNSEKRWGSVSIKTINVWHPGNRPRERYTTDLCVCACLNIYAKCTHKAHNPRCRITNSCIMDGGHYQRVLSSQLCIHEMGPQTALHYLYRHRHRGDVIRSLRMLEMTSGALDFLRRGSCYASVCSEVWLDKHKARSTWSVPNSFVIWFERV